MDPPGEGNRLHCRLQTGSGLDIEIKLIGDAAHLGRTSTRLRIGELAGAQ